MLTNTSIWPVTGIPGAFGYSVTSDAGHSVQQDRIPGASGKQRMTYDEAVAHAQELVDELNPPDPLSSPLPEA